MTRRATRGVSEKLSLLLNKSADRAFMQPPHKFDRMADTLALIYQIALHGAQPHTLTSPQNNAATPPKSQP